MMKYVLLFCALLGVFLMSGFDSASDGMKEHKALSTIDLQQTETQCNFSKADTEQCSNFSLTLQPSFLPASPIQHFIRHC